MATKDKTVKKKASRKTSKKKVARKKSGKVGRPTRYQAQYAEQARKLCLLGYTDVELAGFFEISERTLNTWKKTHGEFLQSIKKGKDIADGEVGEKLYDRAMGYSHDDVHISSYEGEITQTSIVKHYPPDPTSMIFWLKNRQKAKWRDRVAQEISGPNGGPIQHQDMSEDAARAAIDALKGKTAPSQDIENTTESK